MILGLLNFLKNKNIYSAPPKGYIATLSKRELNPKYS